MTYRPTLAVRLGSIALAAVFGALTLVFLAGLFVSLFRSEFGNAGFALVDAVGVGAFGALMWRQSKLRVVVGDTGWHIVNYISTFDLPWDSIERVDSSFGYWGIQVITKDGNAISLNAIQKWNIAVWLHRFTEADQIAKELNERLRALEA